MGRGEEQAWCFGTDPVQADVTQIPGGMEYCGAYAKSTCQEQSFSCEGFPEVHLTESHKLSHCPLPHLRPGPHCVIEPELLGSLGLCLITIDDCVVEQRVPGIIR